MEQAHTRANVKNLRLSVSRADMYSAINILIVKIAENIAIWFVGGIAQPQV